MVNFLEFDIPELDWLSASVLVGRTLLAAIDASLWFDFDSGWTSGPVDRMKSAKSLVLSLSSLASLAVPLGDRAVVGLDFSTEASCFCSSGTEVGGEGNFAWDVGLDRKPLKPFNDTVDLPVEG